MVIRIYCSDCPLDRRDFCLAVIFGIKRECKNGFKYEDSM